VIENVVGKRPRATVYTIAAQKSSLWEKQNKKKPIGTQRSKTLAQWETTGAAVKKKR